MDLVEKGVEQASLRDVDDASYSSWRSWLLAKEMGGTSCGGEEGLYRTQANLRCNRKADLGGGQIGNLLRETTSGGPSLSR